MTHLKSALAVVGCLLLAGPSAAADTASEPGGRALDLAVEDLNPLTRMYVMRFEDNVQFGFGPDDEPLNFFRIQPLIPLDLGERWTLLTRVLLPLAHAPWPETVDGLGDVTITSFVTPAQARRFVWGIGPSLMLPTGSHDQITSNKWSAGPALGAVYNSRRWQAGIVVVTSAGNGGPTPMSIGVPGNVPYVVTVGALTDNYTPSNGSDDRLASFSATGPTYEGFVKPELVAPGGRLARHPAACVGVVFDLMSP